MCRKLLGRFLNRGDHGRMRVPGGAHRDARREVDEAIAVHIPDFGAAPVAHDEFVVAHVARRDDLAVALDERARLRAGQGSLQGGVVHGTDLRCHSTSVCDCSR